MIRKSRTGSASSRDRPSSSPSASWSCCPWRSSSVTSGRYPARYRTVPVLPQDQRHLRRLGLHFLGTHPLAGRLHHFIYLPFIYGPAVCDGGIQAYWLQHLNDFATSAHSLRDMFPQGGFALHGSAKVFGLPGAAWPCTIVPNRKNARKSQPCSFRLRLQPSSAALPNRLNLPSCSSLRSCTSSMPS